MKHLANLLDHVGLRVYQNVIIQQETVENLYIDRRAGTFWQLSGDSSGLFTLIIEYSPDSD